MTPTSVSNRKKEDWIAAAQGLVENIKTWSERKGWLTDVREKLITEDRIGSYSLPELFIRTNQGKLTIDPVGMDIRGWDGRVDIEAFPTLHRFVLVRKNDCWSLLTDSFIEWPEPWGESTFYKIVDALDKTR